MTKLNIPQTSFTDTYNACHKCGSEELVFGGVGGWRETITCGVCFEVRSGLQFDKVLVPLIAEQKGYTEDEVRRAQARADVEYERFLERDY